MDLNKPVKVTFQYTKEETKAIAKIETVIKKVKKDIVVPKELLENTFTAKKIYNQQKISQKNAKDIIGSLKKYKNLQNELNKFSKYSKEDKDVLKKVLDKKLSKIKKLAKERHDDEITKGFKGFIANSKKKSKSTRMKIFLSKDKISKEDKKNLDELSKCNPANIYFGIGVAFFPADNSIEEKLSNGYWRITNIAEGYSADKSGVIMNDTILGAFDNDNNFYEGISFIKNNMNFKNKDMKILINRNGQAIEKTIPVKKVCYSINDALNK
jgi:hypothetical protein